MLVLALLVLPVLLAAAGWLLAAACGFVPSASASFFGPLNVDLVNVNMYINAPPATGSALFAATLQADGTLAAAVTGSAGLALALRLPSLKPCQFSVTVRLPSACCCCCCCLTSPFCADNRLHRLRRSIGQPCRRCLAVARTWWWWINYDHSLLGHPPWNIAVQSVLGRYPTSSPF